MLICRSGFGQFFSCRAHSELANDSLLAFRHARKRKISTRRHKIFVHGVLCSILGRVVAKQNKEFGIRDWPHKILRRVVGGDRALVRHHCVPAHSLRTLLLLSKELI